MKILKKLPLFLAILCTVLASACSEIEVNPRGDGDDEQPPIPIKPKAAPAMMPADTVSIG